MVAWESAGSIHRKADRLKLMVAHGRVQGVYVQLFSFDIKANRIMAW